MKLTITPEAKEQLIQLKNNNSGLLLWYDTEGCGCGVNGVASIRFSKNTDSSYKEIESDWTPTYIHRQQAVFFAEEMKLDFDNQTFRLLSPEGILNPFISVTRLYETAE